MILALNTRTVGRTRGCHHRVVPFRTEYRRGAASQGTATKDKVRSFIRTPSYGALDSIQNSPASSLTSMLMIVLLMMMMMRRIMCKATRLDSVVSYNIHPFRLILRALQLGPVQELDWPVVCLQLADGFQVRRQYWSQESLLIQSDQRERERNCLLICPYSSPKGKPPTKN